MGGAARSSRALALWLIDLDIRILFSAHQGCWTTGCLAGRAMARRVCGEEEAKGSID